jgi:DNA replication and repair protein RecF
MTDIARFDGDGGFSVFATTNDDTEISVNFNAGDTNRRAKVDGENTPLTDLVRNIRIVWITPKEDRLFVEGTSDRRAFFDRLATSFDASHAGRNAKLSKLFY